MLGSTSPPSSSLTHRALITIAIASVGVFLCIANVRFYLSFSVRDDHDIVHSALRSSVMPMPGQGQGQGKALVAELEDDLDDKQRMLNDHEGKTYKIKFEKEVHKMEHARVDLEYAKNQKKAWLSKEKMLEDLIVQAENEKKKLQQEVSKLKKVKQQSNNHGKPEESSKAPYHFDCQAMLSNITVVKELGRGQRKITYEVILPNGIRAAAKRCKDPSGKADDCAKSLMYEGHLFERLYAQYGNQAVQYHGDCSFAYLTAKQLKETVEENTYSDFSIGHTTFMEIGEPLIKDWSEHNPDVKPDHTDEELEDFRVIARQYDNFNGGRLMLGGDCRYAHQYARVAAGIRNVDLDMVQTLPPPNESILDHNCKIVLGFYAGLNRRMDKSFNCTEAYSREQGFLHTETKPQPKAPPKRAVKPAPKKQPAAMAAAPQGVPTLSGWRKAANGSIWGYIRGSPNFSNGERIKTSPVTGAVAPGKVVRTAHGSEYFLS